MSTTTNGITIKPVTAPNPRRKRRGDGVTLKDYLAKLVSEAFNTDKDGKRTRRNPQLANFLNEHSLVRVWNGSPVWRRLPRYYDRKAK